MRKQTLPGYNRSAVDNLSLTSLSPPRLFNTFTTEMDNIKVYGQSDIRSFTRQRSGEEKLGEKVSYSAGTDWQKDLQNSSARYVILGIAEDMGVRANYGRPGAATAFRPALESFLSQQSNFFLPSDQIFVLGEVRTEDLMEEAATLDPKDGRQMEQLRRLVSQLDERVALVIRQIVSTGKIPLVIGGGHNNAYGNIRGTAQALNTKVNVINCDPHLDFREREGRHSGNGFSYAWQEQFLGKYSVFGMHEQYNNQAALNEFRNHPQDLYYTTYESVFVREELDFATALGQSIGFVKGQPCGIELDLDAITNVPTSAKTSSGISPLQARQFVHHCATSLQAAYLHIAEGAPVLSHIKADNKTGKLIAYLLSDFIKGNNQ